MFLLKLCLKDENDMKKPSSQLLTKLDRASKLNTVDL